MLLTASVFSSDASIEFAATSALVIEFAASRAVLTAPVAISLAVILFSAIKLDVIALIAGNVSTGFLPIYAIL